MRQKYGKHWWWMSFPLAYVSQYVMLMGLTLPLHSVSFSTAPWHWLWDDAAVVMCITGTKKHKESIRCFSNHNGSLLRWQHRVHHKCCH